MQLATNTPMKYPCMNRLIFKIDIIMAQLEESFKFVSIKVGRSTFSRHGIIMNSIMILFL